MAVVSLGGVLRHGDAVEDGVAQLERCFEEIRHRCGREVGEETLPRAGR